MVVVPESTMLTFVTALPEGTALIVALPEGTALVVALPEGTAVIVALPEGTAVIVALPEGDAVLSGDSPTARRRAYPVPSSLLGRL